MATFAIRWAPLDPLDLAWVRTGFVAVCLTVLVLPRARAARVGERTILRLPEGESLLADA